MRAIWRGRFSARSWHDLLHRLCQLRPEFADEVTSICHSTEGIERIALLFCLDADASMLRKELERLDSQPDTELARQPFDIFKLANLDWRETGSLYPGLLVRGIERLRSSLLGGGFPSDVKGLGPLGLDVVIPIMEIAAALQGEAIKVYWHKHQLGSVVARYGDKDVRGYVLDQLGNGEPHVRLWIKNQVLRFMDNISTENMSEDAIAFLLSDLSHPNAINVAHNPLGSVASERFVTERLIPLARGASETVLKNLHLVLKAAGDRHGRRYFLPN